MRWGCGGGGGSVKWKCSSKPGTRKGKKEKIKEKKKLRFLSLGRVTVSEELRRTVLLIRGGNVK